MFHAPLCLSNGSLNLAQHLARDHADSLAKLRDGRRGIPVIHLGEVLPKQLRFQTASRLQAVRDAGRCSLAKRRSDVEFIVLRKEGTVNAVDDVPPVIAPVGKRLLTGNLLQLRGEAHGGVRIKDLFKHLPDGRFHLPGDLPGFHSPGILARARVGHVKDIPNGHAVGSRRQQGNALCASTDISAHGAVPKVVFGTGRRVRALGIDQQLIVVRVFVQSG